MTSVPTQPSHVTYVTQGNVIYAPSHVGAEKYAKQFYKLGVVQISLSVLSFILGIVVLSYALDRQGSNYYPNYSQYFDTFAFLGTGIWCSVFFFISGILGVLQGKKKTRCLLIAALTMTIFSALAATTLLVLEIFGAILAGSYAFYWYDNVFEEEWTVSLVIHATLCSLAFTELVTSIVHSAYCCGAHCCQNSGTPVPSQTTYAYVNPVQVSALPGQQPAFIQGPPIAAGMPGQMMQQPVVITSPQPGVNYQVQMQRGFIAPQPNMPQPTGSSQQPPPAYQTPMKA